MKEDEFFIHFEDLTAAEAGEKATLLLEALHSEDPSAQARIEKSQTETMDLGTIVVLMLSAPAVGTIARGIAKFMARERQGKLRIETKDGKIVFHGNSSDAAKIAAAFARKNP
jgi:hypothetical protein